MLRYRCLAPRLSRDLTTCATVFSSVRLLVRQPCLYTPHRQVADDTRSVLQAASPCT